MKKNNNQRKVKIISEIHPQHLGSIDEAKRMILYSKLGGADFVKVQLYDSKLLFNNKRYFFSFSISIFVIISSLTLLIINISFEFTELYKRNDIKILINTFLYIMY